MPTNAVSSIDQTILPYTNAQLALLQKDINGAGVALYCPEDSTP